MRWFHGGGRKHFCDSTMRPMQAAHFSAAVSSADFTCAPTLLLQCMPGRSQAEHRLPAGSTVLKSCMPSSIRQDSKCTYGCCCLVQLSHALVGCFMQDISNANLCWLHCAQCELARCWWCWWCWKECLAQPRRQALPPPCMSPEIGSSHPFERHSDTSPHRAQHRLSTK